MSIGSLLSMRPTWLLGNMYTLTGNGRFQPSLTPAGIANIERISWANAQSSFDVDNTRSIQAHPNGQKSFGFLPWREGGATYVEIGNNVGAQLLMTGPLSACTVWAFQSGGSTVLVHANANAGRTWGEMDNGQKQANLQTKLAAVNAVKALYPNPQDIARLVYANTNGVNGARTYQGYMGFVLGCKPRNGFSLNKVSWTRSSGSDHWTFYFYGFNGATAADRVLWPLD